MGDFRGASPPAAEGVRVHAIDDQLFHIFGTELVLLERAEDERRKIAFKVEVGSFRIKSGAGDTDDNLAAPGATDVTAGAGSLQLVIADGITYFSRPNQLAIQGEGGSDILTYWFIP